uniref:Uncharacterized protein n=1 Tax=Acrobeloides nanus TaxID=290746 RepID=A0A914D6G4_9BILA
MNSHQYKCLYVSAICIAAWNIVYGIIQFIVFLWQLHELKAYEWMKYGAKINSQTSYPENNNVEDRKFYIFYVIRPEFIHDVCYFIVYIVLIISPIHIITSIILLFGIVKEAYVWILAWLFTAVPLIILPIIYAIIWWDKDIFDDQLVICILEFVIALLINVPCAGVILITYFHRKREKREFVPRYQVDRPHIWDNYEKYYDDPTKRPDYPESLDTLSIDDSYYKKTQKIESCTKSPTLSIRRDPWRESTARAARDLLSNLLVIDPALRYSADEALTHEYVVKWEEPGEMRETYPVYNGHIEDLEYSEAEWTKVMFFELKRYELMTLRSKNLNIGIQECPKCIEHRCSCSLCDEKNLEILLMLNQ